MSLALPRYDVEPHRAELAAMLRLLTLGQGCFSLSIAVCNAPLLRDRLIDDLRRQVSGLVVLTIPAETIDVYGFVTAQPEAQGASGLFLIGLEASVSDGSRDHHTLRSLNASRDLWPDYFPFPVIFWLPEYAARALSETARDFWRIRSHRFSFLIHEELPALRSGEAGFIGYSAAESLPHEEKLARIAELEERVTHAGPPTSESRPHVLNWLGELSVLYSIIGDLDFAEGTLHRALSISGREAETAETASVLGNLAVIYETRGELDRAEEFLRKSLAIEEKLGRDDGMAADYGNLGLIYRERGELDRAEEMHRKSLAIQETLGRDDDVARQCGNLGLVYLERGKLNQAEEAFQRALAINQRLGRQEGVARQHANLGLVYLERGDLDRAEEMFRDALNIDEKLGRQEGVANQLANLGSIANDRGELEQAREKWTKARHLFSRIGMLRKVNDCEGLLNMLPPEPKKV